MLWFTTKVLTDKGNICSLSVIKQQLDLRDYATPIADRVQPHQLNVMHGPGGVEHN